MRSSSLYNVELRKRGNEYLACACQHMSWDYLVGKGKTEEDAIEDMKVVVNMYEHEKFPKLRKEINDNYTLVKKIKN